MEAVGQLDQDHPDVVRHGDKHLAVVLGLPRLGVGIVEFGEFGDAIDKLAHMGAEELDDFINRGRRVLDRVVKHSGGHGVGVLAHNGENARHFEGMRNVGFARYAGLPAVHFRGVDISARDEVRMPGGVFLHQIDDIHDPGRRQAIESRRHSLSFHANIKSRERQNKKLPEGGRKRQDGGWKPLRKEDLALFGRGIGTDNSPGETAS